MKILNILVKEDINGPNTAETNAHSNAPTVAVADLSSLQLRTLNRLRDGAVNPDTASEKELEIILQLIDLGVVDADGNVHNLDTSPPPTSTYASKETNSDAVSDDTDDTDETNNTDYTDDTDDTDEYLDYNQNRIY